MTNTLTATRLNQTMLRIRDPEKSLPFYCDVLGMELLERFDFDNMGFSLYFLGFRNALEGERPEDRGDRVEWLFEQSALLELTHNWGQEEPYELGSGFGHLAVGVPDIYGTCEALAAEGVPIPRAPGPMKHGGSVIAFIEDPDGYKVELIERN